MTEKETECKIWTSRSRNFERLCPLFRTKRSWPKSRLWDSPTITFARWRKVSPRWKKALCRLCPVIPVWQISFGGALMKGIWKNSRSTLWRAALTWLKRCCLNRAGNVNNNVTISVTSFKLFPEAFRKVSLFPHLVLLSSNKSRVRRRQLIKLSLITTTI